MKATAVARGVAGRVNPLLGVAGTGAGLAATMMGNGEKESGWKVPEGYTGVRTFMESVARNKEGKPVPKILKPRRLPYFVLPGAQSIKLISTQDRPNDLATIPIERNKRQYIVGASIGWRVSPDGFNPYRALFNVTRGKLDETVVDICRGAFRIAASASDLQGYIEIATDESVTEQARIDRMVSFEEIIYGRMKNLSTEKLLHYGVELGRLTMGVVSPNALEILRPTEGHTGVYGADPRTFAAIDGGTLDEADMASVTPINSA